MPKIAVKSNAAAAAQGRTRRQNCVGEGTEAKHTQGETNTPINTLVRKTSGFINKCPSMCNPVEFATRKFWPRLDKQPKNLFFFIVPKDHWEPSISMRTWLTKRASSWCFNRSRRSSFVSLRCFPSLSLLGLLFQLLLLWWLLLLRRTIVSTMWGDGVRKWRVSNT